MRWTWLFYRFVDLPFKLRQFFRSNDTVQIQCHGIASHMETYIIISVLCMDQTGKDVLSAVVLHIPKTFIPVQPSQDFRSFQNGLVCHMKDHTGFFSGIQNLHRLSVFL